MGSQSGSHSPSSTTRPTAPVRAASTSSGPGTESLWAWFCVTLCDTRSSWETASEVTHHTSSGVDEERPTACSRCLVGCYRFAAVPADSRRSDLHVSDGSEGRTRVSHRSWEEKDGTKRFTGSRYLKQVLLRFSSPELLIVQLLVECGVPSCAVNLSEHLSSVNSSRNPMKLDPPDPKVTESLWCESSSLNPYAGSCNISACCWSICGVKGTFSTSDLKHFLQWTAEPLQNHCLVDGWCLCGVSWLTGPPAGRQRPLLFLSDGGNTAVFIF